MASSLKIARIKRDWSQEALGRKVRISQSRISLIESGLVHPKTDERKRLARTLKTSENELFS